MASVKGRLETVRLKRGWTHYRAAKVAQLAPWQVQAAEEAETRGRLLSHLRLRTAVSLLEAYHPDLQLEDLVPGTTLKLVQA